MTGRIRVLDSANRTMQRLGYLKLLSAIVNENQTSNLQSLGKRLVSRLLQRVRLCPPFSEDLHEYAKTRLTDRVYSSIRKNIMENTGPARVELQDVYLADRTLPSSTGKLVEANWRRYPYLGTSLELIKKGTYSALTRSLVLLALTSKEEMAAFTAVDSTHNPMRISDSQAALFLYCLLDNDAEIVIPLFRHLLDLKGAAFDERVAGNLLPDIIRQVVGSYRDRSLPKADKDRLAALTKVASSIEKWRGRPYTGGGARQEAATVRLEPYCDLGLLSKPSKDKYDYQVTPSMRPLVDRFDSFENIDQFLRRGFFAAFADCKAIVASPAGDEQATRALAQAGERLKSSLGYTPITDVGLLAGIQLLTSEGRLLELDRTFDLLRAVQKEDPSFVRFTVDRMGSLAHVKFLKPAPGM